MKNLLIVGAGIYGVVAKEIAESMRCFEKIAFVDDNKKETPDGIKVVGKTIDIENLVDEHSNVAVAIGDAETRLFFAKVYTNELQHYNVDFAQSLCFPI